MKTMKDVLRPEIESVKKKSLNDNISIQYSEVHNNHFMELNEKYLSENFILNLADIIDNLSDGAILNSSLNDYTDLYGFFYPLTEELSINLITYSIIQSEGLYKGHRYLKAILKNWIESSSYNLNDTIELSIRNIENIKKRDSKKDLLDLYKEQNKDIVFLEEKIETLENIVKSLISKNNELQTVVLEHAKDIAVIKQKKKRWWKVK